MPTTSLLLLWPLGTGRKACIDLRKAQAGPQILDDRLSGRV